MGGARPAPLCCEPRSLLSLTDRLRWLQSGRKERPVRKGNVIGKVMGKRGSVGGGVDMKTNTSELLLLHPP